jgi:hypothetical protein
LRLGAFARVISFFSFRPPRRTRHKGESKAFLCGLPAEGRLSAKKPFATVAKNPPSPLNKGELHPWVSQPLKKEVRFSGVKYLFGVRNRNQSFAAWRPACGRQALRELFLFFFSSAAAD